MKYIITPPGKRSIDVQTLLRLDHLEKLRKSLTTFRNKCRGNADRDEIARSTAETDLRKALGVDHFEEKLVLEKVNNKRKLLGLDELMELKASTSFKQGFYVTDGGDKRPHSTKPVLQKEAVLADLSALQKEFAKDVPEDLVSQTTAIQKALKRLQDDAAAITLARRHGFIKTGLELVTEEACPLCDTPWNEEELRAHLEKKLLSSTGDGGTSWKRSTSASSA